MVNYKRKQIAKAEKKIILLIISQCVSRFISDKKKSLDEQNIDSCSLEQAERIFFESNGEANFTFSCVHGSQQPINRKLSDIIQSQVPKRCQKVQIKKNRQVECVTMANKKKLTFFLIFFLASSFYSVLNYFKVIKPSPH